MSDFLNIVDINKQHNLNLSLTCRESHKKGYISAQN